MSQPIIYHNPHYAMPSQNLKYVPGDINEIRKNTITKVVNINSGFREEMAPKAWPELPKEPNNIFDSRKCGFKTKHKSSDFTIRLPTPLDKVVCMKLSALEIPNTAYVISSELKNNIFTIRVRDLTGILHDNNDEHIIEIASGNYTADQLCEYMNDMFADSTLWPAGAALGIKVYSDSVSGKFYFVKVNGPTVDDDNMKFDLNFGLPNETRDIKLNFGWILGYRLQYYIYEDNYNDGSNWPYTSSHWPAKTDKSSIMYKPAVEKCPEGFITEGIINLAGPKYLFLVVNDFNNNVNNKFTSTLENKLQIPTSNILARISMSHSSYEIGYDDTSDQIQKSREYFGPVTIDKLHIKIVDEYGRVVNLNNVDISLLLEFECLYNL